MEDPPRPDPQGQTWNELTGAHIEHDLLQIHTVHNGVHIHQGQTVPPPVHVPPRQLPRNIDDWVNRDPELRRLSRLTGVGPAGTSPSANAADSAGSAKIALITGSAGIGKTALARRWMHQVSGGYPDAQLYSDLRGYAEGPPVAPEVVLDRFLRALGVAPERIPADRDGRVGLFRSLAYGQRIQILLDNAYDADQVRPLLPGGNGTLVIITSRNQLHGLVAYDEARRVHLDIFSKSHAVKLLRRVMSTDRKRESRDDLAELARLCGYIPLALRLAGTRAASRPGKPLAGFFIEMRDELRILDSLSTGDGSGGDPMRVSFALSYQDLPRDVARLFRVLGLHRVPDISLPAAAAAAGLPERDAERGLERLIGASLVEPGEGNRYRLQHLLHAYALEQSRDVDSEEDRRETVGRIVRWYTVTAHRATKVLVTGREFALDEAALTGLTGAESLSFTEIDKAYAWLDTERPNLVAAASSAMEAELWQRAWELAMVLSPIHASFFIFDDWSVLSELAVAAAEETGDPSMLASALDNRGRFLLRSGKPRDAKEAHARALAVQETAGDQWGICRSRNAFGLIYLQARDLPEAIAHFTGTIEKAREAGEEHWEGTASVNLAHALLESGRVAEATEILTPLPGFLAGLANPVNIGTSHQLIAWANRLRGDTVSAIAEINTALQIAEDAHNSAWKAHWLVEAARVYLAAGETVKALECCRRAVSLQRDLGDLGREAAALDCVGEVLLAMGNAEEAAGRHREAAQVHRDRGDDWQEALALSHLADCEAAIGHGDAAREKAAEALALIDRFTDPRAAKISANLRQYHLD